MTIATIYIGDATEMVKVGLYCSVETEPDKDGTYQVYTQTFPLDRTRDDIIEKEINTGNYLKWPVETVA